MNQSEFNENDPRNRKHFAFHATLFRKLLVAVLRQIFYLIMKMDVQGLENFPLDGSVVIACNHVNNFDVFPMQLSLPRPIFFMAKAELFKFPLMDVALPNLGAFPVYRGEKDAWAMRHARKVLEHGITLERFWKERATKVVDWVSPKPGARTETKVPGWILPNQALKEETELSLL